MIFGFLKFVNFYVTVSLPLPVYVSENCPFGNDKKSSHLFDEPM